MDTRPRARCQRSPAQAPSRCAAPLQDWRQRSSRRSWNAPNCASRPTGLSRQFPGHGVVHQTAETIHSRCADVLLHSFPTAERG
eukprot:CAMPEP_0177442300 /NCGR_PEP_ID=MMETSP0369-20130122/4865_1 /TAXON_ID=447022 ORGANISM="Scrippsiella hangoei-like, Strain SHHI-4" /NCGR_SAMPLE_ID=MMETSP0369 /ASSEMBLY_ACC=CAM_ASM_000364 /LENGTH=83 /DNA_ID=CAMNT_0018914225 /DNA_START=82 /DNA_END=330 /DNA_ORIENTATION=-